MTCPVCRTNNAYPSHRQGFLERGPLTWIGFLPFRCGQCQSRFYSFARRDPRRRHPEGDANWVADRLRAPRWITDVGAVVTVHTPGEASVSLEGTVENASLHGARVRLPVALPEGTQVTVAGEGLVARSGSVRWAQPPGESGILHGIRFQVPLEQRVAGARPLRWLRFRHLLRRVLIALMGLGILAILAFGVIWLIDSLQRYDPKFYEPKDLERQQQQMQRLQQDERQPRHHQEDRPRILGGIGDSRNEILASRSRGEVPRSIRGQIATFLRSAALL